jgi:hypothetical protein
VYYLPDFLIYDVEGEHMSHWRQNIYVEVKGAPDEDSANKVFNCSVGYCEDADDKYGEHGGIPVWVVGNIPDPANYINDMSKQRLNYCDNCRDLPHHCALCINDFGTLDGDYCFEFSIDYTDHLIFRGADSSYGFGTWSEKISKAFRAARQARFEHGETPII